MMNRLKRDMKRQVDFETPAEETLMELMLPVAQSDYEPPEPGDDQRRCWMSYGQCDLYNGHPGPHYFGWYQLNTQMRRALAWMSEFAPFQPGGDAYDEWLVKAAPYLEAKKETKK